MSTWTHDEIDQLVAARGNDHCRRGWPRHRHRDKADVRKLVKHRLPYTNNDIKSVIAAAAMTTTARVATARVVVIRRMQRVVEHAMTTMTMMMTRKDNED